VFVIQCAKCVLDRFPHYWKLARRTLRRAYFTTPKPSIHIFEEGSHNVVVYQRRRNKVDNRNTLLPNSYYVDVMNQVRTQWPDAIFHVLSQSKAKTVTCDTYSPKNVDTRKLNKLYYSQCKLTDERGFGDFSHVPNTKVYLNLSIEQTVHAMVSADALIDSMSSFSFFPAVLSTGHIWHHEMWHPPPPGDWNICKWRNRRAVCCTKNCSQEVDMLWLLKMQRRMN